MSFQKMYGLGGPSGLNMVNQAFIISNRLLAKKKKEEKKEEKKIPGIGQYPMGPTKSLDPKYSLEQKRENLYHRDLLLILSHYLRCQS